MRKTILSLIGGSLIVLSVGQIAQARDSQDTRRTVRQQNATTINNYRNSNAAYGFGYDGASVPSSYANGAASAPAGR